MKERQIPRHDSRDKELAPIRVLPRIRHAQQARLAVLELKVLVGELGSVDGLATSALKYS